MDISLCTSKTCENRAGCDIHISNVKKELLSPQQATMDRSSFCGEYREELNIKAYKDEIGNSQEEL